MAEWPPSSCDPQVDITGTTVTLTGGTLSNTEYTCTIREQFFDSIFINMERKYSDNLFKKAGDSILGLTMIHPGGQNSILVHDDRIEMAEFPHKCRGIFTSKRTLLKIQLHRSRGKTIVTVMTMTKNQYRRCLTFKINELIDGITLKIHATTNTGMIQRIHSISSHDTSDRRYGTENIEKELSLLKEQLSITQNTLRTTIERLEQNHLLVHDNHNEMKKALDSSMRHTDSRIALKVRHHSYGFISVIVISSILMCVFIKYNGYTKKRIEHII